MATKENIQSKINSITSGGNNPATTVRGVLGTDLNSLLEEIYPDAIVDTETTTNVVTKNPSDDSLYSFRILKQGRKVTIRGSVTPLQTSLYGFATITNAEFLPPDLANEQCTGNLFQGAGYPTGNTQKVSIRRELGVTTLSTHGLLQGNTVEFTLIYFTEN